MKEFTGSVKEFLPLLGSLDFDTPIRVSLDVATMRVAIKHTPVEILNIRFDNRRAKTRERIAKVQRFCTSDNRTVAEVAEHFQTPKHVAKRVLDIGVEGGVLRRVKTEVSVKPRTRGRPPHLFKAVKDRVFGK